MPGKVDTKGLKDFAKKLERLNNQQRDDFFNECAKELAARLLRKVIKRTAVKSGTLRRGWTGGAKADVNAFVNDMSITRTGNMYSVVIKNNVSYASYVEYGHRTRNHKGWVQGHFMLQISVDELNTIAPKVLQQKLNRKLKEVFG